MHRILAAHAEVARIALGALAGKIPGVRYGLGGGNGLLAHQVTTRPTQDINVDLFIGAIDNFPEIAALIDGALATAGYQVTRIDPAGDSGIADFWPELGEETGIADREVTSPSGHMTEIEVGHFELLADPVIIDGIQVAGLDDLAGHKTAALVNRRQARDYPDVAALVARATSPPGSSTSPARSTPRSTRTTSPPSASASTCCPTAGSPRSCPTDATRHG